MLPKVARGTLPQDPVSVPPDNAGIMRWVSYHPSRARQRKTREGLNVPITEETLALLFIDLFCLELLGPMEHPCDAHFLNLTMHAV